HCHAPRLAAVAAPVNVLEARGAEQRSQFGGKFDVHRELVPPSRAGPSAGQPMKCRPPPRVSPQCGQGGGAVDMCYSPSFTMISGSQTLVPCSVSTMMLYLWLPARPRAT